MESLISAELSKLNYLSKSNAYATRDIFAVAKIWMWVTSNEK